MAGARHILITGAGSGIGAAIARAFGAAGVAVSLAGRRREPLEAVAAGLERAAVIPADITVPDGATGMVAAANRAFGPVDIIVANAGGAESAPFRATDPALWQRMIGLNLTGAYATVHAALGDVTRPAAAGDIRRIIFIASTAGLKAYPYVSAYVAAKHGVIGLMRALAAELAATPVTVNALCPGFTDTPMLAASVSTITERTGRGEAEARAALARNNPQGRLIHPEEVAAAALWLCSPAAGSVTGQALSISGGET